LALDGGEVSFMSYPLQGIDPWSSSP